MQEEDPASPFFKLPTELIQYIAYLVPSDSDVVNLSLTCFILAKTILPAKSRVWSDRFRDLYDTPNDRSSLQLKIEYQIRRIVLWQKINFSNGEHEAQTLWLEVMQSMLLESLSLSTGNKQTTSKTFEVLREVLFDSDFLNRPVSCYGQREPSTPSNLFCAVQLCLTDLALDPSMCLRCRRTDYDVGAVYSYETDFERQLVSLGELDLRKILHIRNFWLRHLLNPDEATFYIPFHELPECLRPRGRKYLLEEGSGLSSHWLGFDSCIHPWPATLSGLEERQTCGDLGTHLTQVESMSLQIKAHARRFMWPEEFHETIPILAANENLTYFRGVRRAQDASDDSISLVRGFMESIPRPQGGFPGWSRICFVIYVVDLEIFRFYGGNMDDEKKRASWLPEDDWPLILIDSHSIRGYEGVMLPGRRIIIGRYVDMLDTDTRGPFILWDI